MDFEETMKQAGYSQTIDYNVFEKIDKKIRFKVREEFATYYFEARLGNVDFYPHAWGRFALEERSERTGLSQSEIFLSELEDCEKKAKKKIQEIVKKFEKNLRKAGYEKIDEMYMAEKNGVLFELHVGMACGILNASVFEKNEYKQFFERRVYSANWREYLFDPEMDCNLLELEEIAMKKV